MRYNFFMIRVRELDPSEEFYELMENDEIIIYEKETRSFNKMVRNMSENTIKICLRDYPLVKRRLMFDFNIPNLPVAFYFDHMILNSDNFTACKEKIDEIKFDMLELKIERMLKKSKIFVFIEDSPENTSSRRTQHLMNILNKADISNISFGYYNVLLNTRIKNYVCEMVKCKKIPLIFMLGKYIGNLEVIEEMFVQKRLHQIMKQLREL